MANTLRANPVIEVRAYAPEHGAGVLACMVELQDNLRAYEPILRPGHEMSPGYFAYLQAACAEREGEIYVALVDGCVAGLICVWIEREFEALETSVNEVAYVSDLVVREAHRGHGLAKLLLGRAETHARALGAACIQLTVLSSNEPARALYDKVGYQDFRRLMRKPL